MDWKANLFSHISGRKMVIKYNILLSNSFYKKLPQTWLKNVLSGTGDVAYQLTALATFAEDHVDPQLPTIPVWTDLSPSWVSAHIVYIPMGTNTYTSI